MVSVWKFYYDIADMEVGINISTVSSFNLHHIKVLL